MSDRETPHSTEEQNHLEASEQTTGRSMDKYGIKCIAVPLYLYKGFRYSNLDDAISQAKRDKENFLGNE